MLPALIWALVAIHVFWDVFRAGTEAQQATYTVADLVSRGTTPDQAHLVGMRAMLDRLMEGGRGSGAQHHGPASLRVPVVRNPTDAEESDEDPLWLEWSHGAGPDLAPLADLASVRRHIPPLAEGDRVVVLETLVPWAPMASVGVPAADLSNVAVTRPRFGGRVCWESCDPS